MSLDDSEHEAASAKMFTKMDTNDDGFLSKEECEAGHKMMHKDKSACARPPGFPMPGAGVPSGAPRIIRNGAALPSAVRLNTKTL